MPEYQYPIVLSIAGSDSGGGAGIQADIKTISALGCYAATAITAVTVQNTLGVTAIHPIPIETVTGQIKAIMEDLKPWTIKIGMVHSAEIALAIAAILNNYPEVPIVFDPVMVASSGRLLMEESTVEIIKQQLFPLSYLVTPNLSEAAVLAEMDVNTVDEMKTAAARILKTGCNAVLVKGGHLKGPDLADVYLDQAGNEHVFRSLAIASNNTHGTGCTLSSAIASYLALGKDLIYSIEKAKLYVQLAIQGGKDYNMGEGHGPLKHFF